MSEIRKSRKVGGSIILPLTGFIEEGKYYEIEKIGEKVIITKIKK